jgi:NAD(P)-dependent dehydrogenase (short-subunit alcohol dehydrogenase family)
MAGVPSGERKTMELGLRGKVVLITGATANIGRAIALDMATEGARLFLTGRDIEAGARVVRDALARGATDVRFEPADLMEPASATRLVQGATDAFGHIDVLVNNVGGNFTIGHFVESDPAIWQKDVDITLGTVLRMTHAVLPGMIARRSGRIVNIGSTAGTVGDYMLAVYSAAKGAVHSFTRILAKEIGPHGLTVNCVAPYGTATDDPDAFSTGSRMHPEHGFFAREFRKLDPADVAKMPRTGPLERKFVKPEEVAAAVLWLASDRAEFMTGQIVHIDGGTLL